MSWPFVERGPLKKIHRDDRNGTVIDRGMMSAKGRVYPAIYYIRYRESRWWIAHLQDMTVSRRERYAP